MSQGIIAVRITNYGIETLLSASMPDYEDCLTMSVLLIVNDGVQRAEELGELLGQPAVFANHALEELRDQDHIVLSGECSPYRRVAIVNASLRRLASELDQGETL